MLLAKLFAKPANVIVLDEQAQATFVADCVLEARERGVDLRRQAVLFRNADHSDVLELELRADVLRQPARDLDAADVVGDGVMAARLGDEDAVAGPQVLQGKHLKLLARQDNRMIEALAWD